MNKCSVSKQTIYNALKVMKLDPVGEKYSDNSTTGQKEILYSAGVEDRQIYLWCSQNFRHLKFLFKVSKKLRAGSSKIRNHEWL